MATFALTNAYIALNGTVLSDHASSVALSFEIDDLEDTAFGDVARSRIGGLKDVTLDITWNQDFVELEAFLYPLQGTVATFAIRQDGTAAISATNPEYQGSVLINEFSPLDGSVGDLATFSTSWPGASGAGVVRDIVA